jgi:hypothetical protein
MPILVYYQSQSARFSGFSGWEKLFLGSNGLPYLFLVHVDQEVVS